MNIKLVMTLCAAIIIVSLALTGCGDTVSQSASGGGSNCSANDGSCSITLYMTTAEKIAEASGTSVEWTDTPGCSVGSRAEGRC